MRYLAAAVLLASLTRLAGAESVDLEKIERWIANEPAYTAAEPLYGLAVFGPEASTRIWMVLDKSDAEVDVYDVLYVDLNGNGDLTDAAERVVAEDANTYTSRFHIDTFTDPQNGVQHADLSLRATRGVHPTFMISLMWRGELKFGGGYARDGNAGYMQFASLAEQAPIVWINGDGPFRFQRWYSEELHIGSADDFKVFLGQQGVGENSFGSFQCHALPEGEPVLASLIYRDRDGKEQTVGYELKERC